MSPLIACIYHLHTVDELTMNSHEFFLPVVVVMLPCVRVCVHLGTECAFLLQSRSERLIEDTMLGNEKRTL